MHGLAFNTAPVATIDHAKAKLGDEPIGTDTQLRVLVVDDDPDMRAMLSDYLVREGMAVSLAANGKDMLRLLSGSTFTLIILDLRLGDEDGLDLLRGIRARTDVPVIVVTGHRREEHERVLGLELGADDYVVKPFALRELLARMRSLLRRRRTNTDAVDRVETSRVSTFEGWSVDRETRRLCDPTGRHVPLTKGEYVTLLVFLDRPGRVVTRQTLLAATGMHDDRVDRSVDVQVLRLRRKLEVDPTAPRFIRTERGQGYVFAVDVESRNDVTE